MRRSLCLDRLLETHHGEEVGRGAGHNRRSSNRRSTSKVLGYRNEIMWMKVTQSRGVGEEEEV
jgi:hypothetical protein